MTRITFRRGTRVAGSVMLAGTVVLAGCLLLSACSTASPSSTAASAPRAPAAVQGRAEFGAAGQPGTASPGQVSRSLAAKLAPGSEDIIYTASLTLRSANAMLTANRAIAIVSAAGGYTSSEHAVAGRAGGGTVSLQLKVPVSAYAGVLAELSSPALGTQVALTQQATDVTQEVADVTSLVSSQQAAITALQGLLRRAGSISALLQVQQQISGDESTLESLQAQQRALDRETTYATITMTLLSASHHAGARKHPATHGFLAGLSAGWRALRHALGWFLTALGAVLPFLVIVAIVAGLVYGGRRRFARRGTGPTAAD